MGLTEGLSMFERYTDRARRTIVLAQENARMLNHNYIGSEHLVIGLIAEGGGVAFQALTALGVTENAVRDAVVDRIGLGQHIPAGHVPFTPRLKKVLELGLRESLQLGCSYVATEHLLLGLIREGDGTGAKALESCGTPSGELPFLSDVRAKVLELLRGYAETEGKSRVKASPDLSSLPWRPGRHVGRTIYATPADDRDGDGTLIGVMDTPELAAAACSAHNAALANPAC
jgi:ATP-dependent Clp protease ATP-binding subunit ClpC